MEYSECKILYCSAVIISLKKLNKCGIINLDHIIIK